MPHLISQSLILPGSLKVIYLFAHCFYDECGNFSSCFV